MFAIMPSMAFSKKQIYQFIILLGFVSLFSDVTYEGARSIAGPYLATMGASATVVGFVAGFGELVGYALRLVSGYISDKTRRYWLITMFGYSVNLIAVPVLALAGNWKIAAMLMMAERMGKAIRTPARDAMLAHASHEIGRGWGFGLHEAMDQIGAMLGPLVVALVLYFKQDYRPAFAVLLIPAILALSVLCLARFLYPRPHDLEIAVPKIEPKGFSKVFWLYCVAAGLIAAGYADFPLIAFHFEKSGEISKIWIPVFYSVAMGVDAIAALIFGRWFDRRGMGILIFSGVLSMAFAPFVFWGGFKGALFGMALWGIGMGAHESVMRAAVSNIVSSQRRGTAFGVFNTVYGVAWFLGSAAMGMLYDRSITAMVFFSILSQASALPFLWYSIKRVVSQP